MSGWDVFSVLFWLTKWSGQNDHKLTEWSGQIDHELTEWSGQIDH